MFELIGTLLFYASAVCFIIGIVFIAAGAFLLIGGLFGIVFGSSTSIALSGLPLSLGVLGSSAVIMGIVLSLYRMGSLAYLVCIASTATHPIHGFYIPVHSGYYITVSVAFRATYAFSPAPTAWTRTFRACVLAG